MAVKEVRAVRPSARERLLAAADELFYNEGEGELFAQPDYRGS